MPRYEIVHVVAAPVERVAEHHYTREFDEFFFATRQLGSVEEVRPYEPIATESQRTLSAEERAATGCSADVTATQRRVRVRLAGRAVRVLSTMLWFGGVNTEADGTLVYEATQQRSDDGRRVHFQLHLPISWLSISGETRCSRAAVAAATKGSDNASTEKTHYATLLDVEVYTASSALISPIIARLVASFLTAEYGELAASLGAYVAPRKHDLG